MFNINEFRRQRAEINAQVQVLAMIEAGGTQLTTKQLASFAALSASFDALGEQMSRLEAAEKMASQHAAPVKASVTTPVVHVKTEATKYKGSAAARTIMSIAASKGDLNLAANFARNEIRDNDVAMAIETSSGSGGSLIPQNTANEVIELLRPKTIVLALGAQTMPLINGNMTLPRLAGGAVSSYIGEGADVNATESEFDDVKLSEKRMITLVPLSNLLIGQAGFNIENIVLNDMLNSMAIRTDKAGLRDDGSNNTPIGFKKIATDASRTEAWSGAPSLATIDAYLDLLILRLMNSNSMMVSPGWGLSPRTFMTLFGLRDGNGNKVYPEMATGTLKGYPVKHTTTIPINLGGGTETEIYFADWNDVIFGDAGSMSVDFSKEATYKDSDGSLVSAFARDQSVIRVVNGHDFGFRHNEGLILGTGVTF